MVDNMVKNKKDSDKKVRPNKLVNPVAQVSYNKEEMEKELQKKYFQHQVLKQQMAAFLEEKLVIENKINEITETIDAVKKLAEIKHGQEIWSSLGSKTFVRTDIKDIENVTVELGAGVFGRKTREEAIDILSKKRDELANLNNELVLELNKMNSQVTKLEPEIQFLASKMQEK